LVLNENKSGQSYNISANIPTGRRSNIVLFVQFFRFAGGMMFFHNIGKIQDYNEIVNSYPSFAFAGSPAVFVIVSLVEVVLATLIIMGLWVRASAIVMAAGILGVLLWGAPGFGTLAFTWLGVYVFLGMSGGWLYAFDTALFPAKRKN
jgi:putative oxidoreductase